MKANQWPRYAGNRPPPLSLLGYDEKSKKVWESAQAKNLAKRNRRNVFPVVTVAPAAIVPSTEEINANIADENPIERNDTQDFYNLALGSSEDVLFDSASYDVDNDNDNDNDLTNHSEVLTVGNVAKISELSSIDGSYFPSLGDANLKARSRGLSEYSKQSGKSQAISELTDEDF